jgi:hypothetical protein
MEIISVGGGFPNSFVDDYGRSDRGLAALQMSSDEDMAATSDYDKPFAARYLMYDVSIHACI